MPASANYLKKYLTAGAASSSNGDFEDSSRPKKRRKKDRASNLIIADDDDGLRLSDSNTRDNNEEDGPLVYATKQRSAEFRKKKDSAWQSVGQNATAGGAPIDSTTQDDADAILASAAEESAARRAAVEAEDAPTVVPTNDGPRMSSGPKAGLQTIEDSLALEAEQERSERKAKKNKPRKEDEVAQETIYRDATGRRIDISLKRQELRAQEAAKLAAEKKERESAMGDVQLQQRAQAKEDLENAKFLTLGRSADDEELNQAQKDELRWEDPMAQYMAEREAEKEADEVSRNPKSRRKQKDGDNDAPKLKKRQYLGAAPPNRYGIRPGWRWDGVDRGTGFEKEWFQARGKKSRNENLEYQWQMDE